MKFTKMQGIGNDYLYINCMEGIDFDPVETSIKLSDRHFGVGSDGIILICPSEIADFKMRMFNADGSEGKMCGNGIRCFAKYVYAKGLTDKTELQIETLSGIKTVQLILTDGEVTAVRVDMGSPIFEPSQIPMNYKANDAICRAISINNSVWYVTCLSMGNPHCVVFVDDVDSFDVTKNGPGFENDPLFPERVNTEFVQSIDGHTIRMRVWERGSGETLACGTGACAAAIAAIFHDYIDEDTCVITVQLRGGDLQIEWNRDEGRNTVYMTGPAEFVFEGEA